MLSGEDFIQFLEESSVVILPGGVGTELLRRGFRTDLPLWSARANDDAPEIVKSIHRDYFAAGADIGITNTFRTTRRTYAKVGGQEQARRSLKSAFSSLRSAQAEVENRKTYIGASFAPLEDCYRPDWVPSQDELESEHHEIVEWLAAENPDFLLAETVNALTEAKIMASAASDSGIPFIISFVVNEHGVLLDGTSIQRAVEETHLPGRVAVSLNCRPVDTLLSAFDALKACYHGNIGLYPNGFGHPDDEQGWVFEENSDGIERFLQVCQSWHDKGVKIIGGCCGTTPEYIQALARNFSGKR